MLIPYIFFCAFLESLRSCLTCHFSKATYLIYKYRGGFKVGFFSMRCPKDLKLKRGTILIWQNCNNSCIVSEVRLLIFAWLLSLSWKEALAWFCIIAAMTAHGSEVRLLAFTRLCMHIPLLHCWSRWFITRIQGDWDWIE